MTAVSTLADARGLPRNRGGRIDLDESLDLQKLQQEFVACGRVSIARVLRPDSAVLLAELLSSERDWGLSLAAGFAGRRFLHPTARRGLTELQTREIFEAAYADCGRSFSHLYETISLATYHQPQSPAAAWYGQFLQFIRSERFLQALRTLTGLRDIRSATAVACRYSKGHFYASHIDEIGGTGHRASFVLNLTRSWEPQWGGVLQFKGVRGEIAAAYVPRFNSMSLFLATQPHGVSLVNDCAPYPRLSITGALIA